MAKAPDPKQVAKDTAAKAARERVEAFNAFEVKAHVAGQVHTFCAGDVSARHVAALRSALGSTLIDPVLNMVQYFSPDSRVVALDKVAELVFLARLQAGEVVTFDDVADTITARTEVWFEFPTGEAPDPGGEAMFLDPPASSDG